MKARIAQVVSLRTLRTVYLLNTDFGASTEAKIFVRGEAFCLPIGPAQMRVVYIGKDFAIAAEKSNIHLRAVKSRGRTREITLEGKGRTPLALKGLGRNFLELKADGRKVPAVRKGGDGLVRFSLSITEKTKLEIR